MKDIEGRLERLRDLSDILNTTIVLKQHLKYLILSLIHL